MNVAEMFLFSKNSVGKELLTVTISSDGWQMLLLEVSSELRLISKTSKFSGSV